MQIYNSPIFLKRELDKHEYNKYNLYNKSYKTSFLKNVPQSKERVKNMTDTKGQYMWTVTVGEKGQIVIPKQARDIFNIKSGDQLMLFGDKERGIAIPPKETYEEIFLRAFDRKESDQK